MRSASRAHRHLAQLHRNVFDPKGMPAAVVMHARELLHTSLSGPSTTSEPPR